MSGVKGRSGRKTKLEGLQIDEILALSNKTVRQCLEDESIDIYKRGELGMRFICKYMPSRVESTLKVLQISDATIARLINMMESNNRPKNVLECQENNVIDAVVIEPKSLNTIDLDNNNET